MLPITVTDVQRRKAGLWAVTVAFSDGSTQTIVVPESLATVEAVSVSAVALAVLSELAVPDPSSPQHVPAHRWPSR
jgi:hypothetical protein